LRINVKKISPPKSVTHPISAKIIAGLRKTNSRKVVDISELRDAKITAENLKKTVITEKPHTILYTPPHSHRPHRPVWSRMMRE
jgi:hypothetical protein